MSSLASSEKGTLVESNCPKCRMKPTMGLVPRPEDGHMVIMVVRQVTGTLLVSQPKAYEYLNRV